MMNVDNMYKHANLLVKLVASSVNISKRAGQIIRSTLGTNLEIIQKSAANDLQTIADRRSQNCIISSLKHKFGNDLIIIGEEDEDVDSGIAQEALENSFDPDVLAYDHSCSKQYKEIDRKDIVVWVDPLDGTSEFTEGLLDHVTVLIGIAVKGRAIAGVIHQPFFGYNEKQPSLDNLGRTIWAIQGMGAHGIDLRSPPADSRIITTTRSHSNKLVTSAVEAVKPDEVLRVGGAGHKVMLLMEGRAHAYVFASKGCKKWDTCAPEAVLAALGGCLTDLLGNNIVYEAAVEKPNSNGVLATAPGVDHKWYVDMMPEDLKRSLPFT